MAEHPIGYRDDNVILGLPVDQVTSVLIEGQGWTLIEKGSLELVPREAWSFAWRGKPFAIHVALNKIVAVRGATR